MFLYIKVFFVAFSLTSIPALPARSTNGITVNGSQNWIFIPNDRGEIQLAILDEPEVQQRADVAKDVKFLLFTRSNPNGKTITIGDSEGLFAASFNPSHPTKILIHGFGGGADSSIIVDGKNAYLAKGDYNVIGVDWGKLCVSPWYSSAVKNTRPVGEHIGRMVDFLVSSEANLRDIHLIGHSLGSHVAGFAGTCSHSKAVEYFIHSIGNERTFPASRCQSLSEAEKGPCTGDGGYMGESVSFGNHGLYYVGVK
ncbi:hypothetical protein C0J52_18859 [Blattella germanica]|nr:hypothetical protein C0J52_18859 [Blattella germanica]